MTLAIARLAEPVAPALRSLDPRAWLDKVRRFAALAADKKRLDAEARAAGSVYTAARDELLAELGGASAAVCGSLVLTVKHGKPAAASLTLSDGRTIPWASVSAVVVGNVHIPAGQVLKLYGGRDGSVSVEVAGA